MPFADGVRLKERVEVSFGEGGTMPTHLRCPSGHKATLVVLLFEDEGRAATFPCYPCLDCGVVYRASECRQVHDL
jgi:hypothetical protein